MGGGRGEWKGSDGTEVVVVMLENKHASPDFQGPLHHDHPRLYLI